MKQSPGGLTCQGFVVGPWRLVPGSSRQSSPGIRPPASVPRHPSPGIRPPALKRRAEETKPAEAGWDVCQPASAGFVSSAPGLSLGFLGFLGFLGCIPAITTAASGRSPRYRPSCSA